MLEMVRLVDEADQDEDEGQKSATAFFKIPKAARKKPAAPPAPGGAPRIGAPPVAGAIPGGPPPMAGGPPPIAGPPGGGMISGPVAGGPMAIGGPTAGAPGGAPFAGVHEPDHSADIGKNRTRSFVTLAIVLLMVMTLLGAIVIAGAGLAYYLMNQEEKDAAEDDADADAIEWLVPTDDSWM